MNEQARDRIAQKVAVGAAQRKITPFPFESFPFTPIKVATFQLATLVLILLGHAQVGAAAFPRMAAEFMVFLRGNGLLPINKN